MDIYMCEILLGSKEVLNVKYYGLNNISDHACNLNSTLEIWNCVITFREYKKYQPENVMAWTWIFIMLEQWYWCLQEIKGLLTLGLGHWQLLTLESLTWQLLTLESLTTNVWHIFMILSRSNISVQTCGTDTIFEHACKLDFLWSWVKLMAHP